MIRDISSDSRRGKNVCEKNENKINDKKKKKNKPNDCSKLLVVVYISVQCNVV